MVIWLDSAVQLDECLLMGNNVCLIQVSPGRAPLYFVLVTAVNGYQISL